LPAYGLQGSFGPTISALLNQYNTAPPADELRRAQNELDQVKSIMVQNVEQILSRGERIELLVDKTDVMAGQATAFRRGARTVRRQMWWKNKKILGLSILVGLVSSFLAHNVTVTDLDAVVLPLSSHCTSLWCRLKSMWLFRQEDLVVRTLLRHLIPQIMPYILRP